jgi:hypothetical protein
MKKRILLLALSIVTAPVMAMEMAPTLVEQKQRFVCASCDETLSSQSKLNKHIRSQHSAVSKKWRILYAYF